MKVNASDINGVIKQCQVKKKIKIFESVRILFIICNVCIAAFFPWIYKIYFSFFFNSFDFNGFYLIAIFVLLLLFSRMFFNVADEFVCVKLRMNYIHEMRFAILNRMLKWRVDCRKTYDIGGIINKTISDVDIFSNVTIVHRSIMSAYLQLGILFLFMPFLNFSIIPVFLLGIGVFILLYKVLSFNVGSIEKKMGITNDEKIESALGIFSFIETIKSFQMSEYIKTLIGKTDILVKHVTQINVFWKSLFENSTLICESITSCFLMLLSGFLLLTGKISIGDFATAFSFIYLVLSSVSTLLQNSRIKISIIEAERRINDLFMYECEATSGKLVDKNYNLAFKMVNVSCTMENSTILKDISLEIPKGSLVAIVGESGSGKSSLLNVLARLYPQTSGDITYFGNSLKSLNEKSLRKSLSICFQDSLLLNDSIRLNVCLDKTISQDHLDYVYDLTKVSLIFKERDESDLMVIGEKGKFISGGERQRINIAKAVVHTEDVILLDEPYSALNSDLADEINHALCTHVRQNKQTLIMVTHKLSVCSLFDSVIVLKAGKLVEVGSYQQLLSMCGHFYKMAQNQGLVK
jgi:ABC-type multidrug transport system fused ATPase/permease subunit